MKIGIYCYDNPGIVNKIISYKTWGRINHIGIKTEDGFFEALGGRRDVKSEIHRGEDEYTFHQGDKAPISLEVFEFDVPQNIHDKISIKLQAYVGMKYPFVEILGFLFPFVPTQSGWYCSELAKIVFEEAFGIHINNRLSPREVHNIARFIHTSLNNKDIKPI